MHSPARTAINAVPAPAGPYSHAIVSNGLVHLSGALAEQGEGRIAARGDLAGQMRIILERLSTRLRAAGSSLDRVVAVVVYLRSSSDFAAMNEVYRGYWPTDPPTRTTVITDLVLPDALVEIAMIAAVDGAERDVIHPPGWQPSASPYSYGIRTGDTVFLSGIVSRSGRDNSVVEGDVGLQTRVVLDNAAELLQAAGMTLADVVSARVYLTDANTFDQMNVVYRKYFTSSPPVRATVRAGLAAPLFSVEVTLIASSAPRAVIEPGTTRNPNLSSAIAAGRHVYLSGMLGNRPDNQGDVGAQTRETLDRIGRTLAAAGCSPADVVDSLVYLPDLHDYAAMNDAYRTFFDRELPARTTVQADLFAPDGLVEIMMTAVRP